ncbi:LysR family transcriptional regulator [Caballeronia insecticola]|uniref:Transcriptional regulator LysR family n=1 Tax=Caballeronia insecticola TaxID=758793 RepID=A0A060PR82_9BURK|nr:LysR family transcriptional regulator [Caballeronia insecticola]BAO93980.1 transcriptional regulator LysR family [Caballeronia insecticola]
MDRLEAMALLISAAETGSLSAAARAQNTPVSTLTRKITDLEELLGTKLLIRTTRKLTLTDTGIAFVAAARAILEQVDALEREAKGEFTTPRGELVVATPVRFGRLHLLPIIEEFLTEYPQIRIKLLQSDRNVDLVDVHADLAVRIGPLPDSSMVATRVGALRAVLCASPSLLDKCGTPNTPQDLITMPSVIFNSPYLWPWRFRLSPGTEATTLAVEPRLEVLAPDAATDAAAAGIGVTLVLEHDADKDLRSGRLVVLLPQYEVSPIPVHLLHVSRNVMPLKLRRFLDFAAPKLRDSLGRFGQSQR